jgi:predicted RNA-binding Zn-ribbon protein involved in translation (DUF1610 family)
MENKINHKEDELPSNNMLEEEQANYREPSELPANLNPQVKNEENNLYSDKLEKLIDFALTDGTLTEKEKQILFKNAEAEGIDLDEFQMVLDAKIHQIQSRKTSIQEKENEPKSDKFGDVNKCPACGAVVISFTSKCADCGSDYTNIEANASIQKLFKMLDEVESQRDDQITASSILGGLFNNGIGGGALSSILGGGNKTDKRKKEIISTFPIPNTKNDILEFLTLAFPKATQKGNFLTKNNPENIDHNEFVPVWKAKTEQIIMKARFALKEDKKTLDEINYYANQLGIK